MTRVTLDQLNIVSGDPAASVAFYRRLGLDIADPQIWRTPTGIHHVSAARRSGDQTIRLDIDSAAFAQLWNKGWAGRDDLRGRVVVGFSVPTRAAVDEVYRDMTGAGYRGLQQPCDAFWGARYAIIEDPDGVAVGLMSPIEPDRKSEPPQV
jgi:catechol 2,3-dioxygenase-like lactoylglutathione lyase family enzyme